MSAIKEQIRLNVEHSTKWEIPFWLRKEIIYRLLEKGAQHSQASVYYDLKERCAKPKE